MYVIVEKVEFNFSFFIIVSMFIGKKVMYLDGMFSFDFLFGELVVMFVNQCMVIDFFIVMRNVLIQCLVFGIDSDKIIEVVYYFNQVI